MQTFLPYSDFSKSAKVLDHRRLNKQITESQQLIGAILGVPTASGKPSRWINHSCSKMWKNHVAALVEYTRACHKELLSRPQTKTKYHKSMQTIDTYVVDYDIDMDNIQYPEWLGDERLHASMRSNLLKKSRTDDKYPNYYDVCGWDESEDIMYVWFKPSYTKGSWQAYNIVPVPGSKSKTMHINI